MRVHLPYHWTLRTWLGRSPAAFNAMFGLVNDGARLTRADAELVIEGFPRSGKSFSVFAFSNFGADALRLAHHVHSPPLIVLAARYRLLAVVLIRAPDDAVNRRFGTDYDPVDAERHKQLSKAFLAGEKMEALVGGEVSGSTGPASPRYDSALAERARTMHARFLEMAAGDATD